MSSRPTRLGLIGSHAAAAMSPQLWAPVLAACGNDWTYEAWQVDARELDGVRDRLLAPDIIGFNVTMPFKRWAAETANERTESVARSAAANLLIRRGQRLEAHNTDIDAMRALLDGWEGGGMLILGAGGAGRAALVAASDRVGEVVVTDRDMGAAVDTVRFGEEQGLRARAIAWESRQTELARATLVVNATPIGMRASDPSAWGTPAASAKTLFYDFVYARHETASVRAARVAGRRVVDGWAHLVGQAQAMIPLLGLPEAARQYLEASAVALREAT